MTKSYTYKNKGKKLFNDGKYLEAIKNFDNSIKGNPKNYESWDYRGLCKFMLGQYEEAVKDLDKATELCPNHAYYSNWNFKGRSNYF